MRYHHNPRNECGAARPVHLAAFRLSVARLLLVVLALSLGSVTNAYTAQQQQLQQQQPPPLQGQGQGQLRGERHYPVPPNMSPATNLPNQLYRWRHGQQIRYQRAGPPTGEPVLLVHGLFVNSDHWRKTLLGLAGMGYNVYAIDLWGYGYSSKPPLDSPEAQAVNGETWRFNVAADLVADGTSTGPSTSGGDILRKIPLGTSDGRGVRIRDIDLRHPIQSPYNFYTWSDLITDFTRDIIVAKGDGRGNDDFVDPPVTLVSNSIGTISALQAVIDTPDLYTGVCVVTPNFRELHSAEIPVPSLCMPVIRALQRVLRERGQPLFDALATPNTVKQILKEPYQVHDAIDDTLVQVLLDPLLLEGASNVVFDTLSYSAGPLPEQQLAMFPPNKPVWITYGTADPWTPEARVDALLRKQCVEKVVPLPGVGHCPHDEAPELVNQFIADFLKRVHNAPSTTI